MKCTPTLRAQFCFSGWYTGKGAKQIIHFHLVPKMSMCGRNPTKNLIRTSYLSTGLNQSELFWIRIIFLNFPRICTLLIFLYNKITNSHCKLTYRCRNCAKNGVENFWQLWYHREWRESVWSCMYSRKVVVIGSILGKIR